MSDQGNTPTLVARPSVDREQKAASRPKKQPRYSVILWDDDHHTYEYVIQMMRQLFGYSLNKGFQMAKRVDNAGKCVCLTTTREHAELKRDQIHAFGKDVLLAKCDGSMSASIEPETD